MRGLFFLRCFKFCSAEGLGEQIHFEHGSHKLNSMFESAEQSHLFSRQIKHSLLWSLICISKTFVEADNSFFEGTIMFLFRGFCRSQSNSGDNAGSGSASGSSDMLFKVLLLNILLKRSESCSRSRRRSSTSPGA